MMRSSTAIGSAAAGASSWPRIVVLRAEWVKRSPLPLADQPRQQAKHPRRWQSSLRCMYLIRQVSEAVIVNFIKTMAVKTTGNCQGCVVGRPQLLDGMSILISKPKSTLGHGSKTGCNHFYSRHPLSMLGPAHHISIEPLQISKPSSKKEQNFHLSSVQPNSIVLISSTVLVFCSYA